jgi:hypothetical protein
MSYESSKFNLNTRTRERPDTKDSTETLVGWGAQFKLAFGMSCCMC